jgi:hypothetical protein
VSTRSARGSRLQPVSSSRCAASLQSAGFDETGQRSVVYRCFGAFLVPHLLLPSRSLDFVQDDSTPRARSTFIAAYRYSEGIIRFQVCSHAIAGPTQFDNGRMVAARDQLKSLVSGTKQLVIFSLHRLVLLRTFTSRGYISLSFPRVAASGSRNRDSEFEPSHVS